MGACSDRRHACADSYKGVFMSKMTEQDKEFLRNFAAGADKASKMYDLQGLIFGLAILLMAVAPITWVLCWFILELLKVFL